MHTNVRQRNRIGLLGASFDTGNMGVNALAESAIKCILHQWPDAEITQLDSGREVGEHQLRIGDKDLRIKKLPIRFCKNIFLENHFLVLCLYAFLFKVFRGKKLKGFCARRNASLRSIIQMDMVADITGGDSFSDIYGMRRFVIGFVRKWLVLQFKKDLIMLPQTYGPFKRKTTKTMARYILKRAKVIYSRDHAGMEYVQRLLGDSHTGQLRFSPDVAFVLDARRPDNAEINSLERIKSSNRMLIGMNISGLLFNGGYNRNNMFGLKSNYRELIYPIIERLLKNEGAVVLLIPHVFPPKGFDVESDPDACQQVFQQVREKHEGRVFLVRGEYNQNEMKYIIGMCDFLIGSRMHACIAALSQGIPAVGVAYSKKFNGVFESIGLADCVVDAREFDEREALDKVGAIFERRDQICKHLGDVMPQVKKDILSVFGVAPLKGLGERQF